MNNHKQTHINRSNASPERRQPVPAAVVRSNEIHNGAKRLIIARNAEMSLQHNAPKHPELMFSSGYVDFLTKQAVATSGNVVPVEKDKNTKPVHEVAEKISDHEVTDKPQVLDLDDRAQESAADEFVLDAMASDITPEISEANEQPERPAIKTQEAKLSDADVPKSTAKGVTDEKLAKIYQLEEARRRVAEAREGNNNGNIQKSAA